MRRRKPTLEEQTAGLGLFSVERRDVRTDPPSQPVESSERGAEHVKPRAEDQRMAVLAVLARLPLGHRLSREEISSRSGIKESSLCGRLDELVKLGHVERIERGATSSAGISVLGYAITETGRNRIRVAS